MAVDGYLNFNTKIDTKGFNAGTKQITNGLAGMKSMLGKIGGAVAVAFSVRELVSFGKEAINLASDVQEVQNVVDVSFGHLKGQMEEFAATSIQNYGISKLVAKQTGSTYMAMAKGMQIADKNAAEMATTITGLSADMASFYNKEQSVTATALNSVFTGETETLKQFGIVMTEANLQQFAYTQGINKKISAMSQAEKVQLRYNYVMQQTALAQGDFARTQDGWANQTRILSEMWKEFAGTVGTILMNTLLPAVQSLNKAMAWLNTVAQDVLETLSAVFDWDVEANNAGAVSDAIGTAVDNQNALTDAVNETAEAQERQLMGFDKINKLNDDSSSGSSGASAVVGGSMTATMTLDADTTKAEEKLTGTAARIKEAWETGDYSGLGKIFAQKVNSALSFAANDIDYEGIKEKIKPKIQGLASGISTFVDEVDWSLLTQALSNGISFALTTLDFTLEGFDFNAIGGMVGELIAGIDFSLLLGDFGSLLSTAFVGGLDLFSGFLQSLDWGEIFTDVYEGIKNFFINIDWSEVFASVAELLGSGLGNSLEMLFSGLELGKKIIENIVAGLSSVKDYFDEKIKEAGGNIVLGIWNGITDALSNVGKWIKENIFQPFIDGFKKAFGIASPAKEMKPMGGYIIDGLKEGIGNIWSKVKEKFTEMLKNCKQWFKDKKEELKKSWTNFTSVVKDKTAKMKASIATKLSDFKEGWKKRADLVKNKTAKMKASVATKVADFKTSWKKRADLVKSKTANMKASVATKLNDFKNSWQQRADLVKDKAANMSLKFAETKEKIKEAAKERYDAITEVFSNISTWFRDRFSEAWQKVKDVFSSGGQVFDGIKDGILSGLKTVVNALIDGINKVIAVPFNGINTALEKVKNVSIAGSQPFYDKISTINVPQIPKLATGTVVPANYGEFLAILGDNKRETEVVSPLSTIKKAVAEVMGAGGEQTINLVVELDGEVVYRKVVRKNKQNTKMTGVNELATA